LIVNVFCNIKTFEQLNKLLSFEINSSLKSLTWEQYTTPPTDDRGGALLSYA